MLDRPAPTPFYQFMVVALDNAVSLDFMEKEGEIARQHYAFLVDDEDFDPAFARIQAEGLTYWADPGRTQPGEINHRFGGRGVYFEDPDGHLLEIITRPYAAE
jgi:catechol 2,3-dioxygenase-like lactoylglutathione lyase family enzyme